ncbi:MAG: hypothetical protein ACM3O3_05905 [Syntrophothermus sp.]|nr:hypothetical protein [Ignavibacteriaceae bacterium]
MTDEVKNIFVVVLLLSVSALCIGLIIYLRKITKTVTDIGFDIKDLSLQIKPLIASTTNLTEKLNAITEEVKEPIDTARNIVADVKERVDRYLEIEERVRLSVEKPVTDFSQNLSAVLNGVNAFWTTYRDRR